MRFKEITARLTGLSCPIFGLSWDPPEAERAIGRRLLTFLEDRRVLYVDSEMEVPEHCVSSVLKIRRFLTTEIAALAQDSELGKAMRAMRAACRKFLEKVNADEQIVAFGASQGHYASWAFNGALGEMRGVFGVHIAKTAASYGLDVEDDLSKIIPRGDAA